MNKNGFTLIELLVVIAIIALLLSILIPALNIVKMHATAAVCLANLSGLSKGWHLYATDNDGRIVGAFVDDNVRPDYSWVERPSPDNAGIEEKERAIMAGALFPYIEATKAYHCPGDRRSLKPRVSDNTGYGAYRSYLIAGGLKGVGTLSNGWSGWQIYAHVSIDNIRGPGNKYVFVEEADGRGVNMGSWVINPRTREWVDPFAIWHNERSTLGYADGHAEKHQWVNESTIRWSETQDPYNPLGPNDPRNDLDYMIRAYPYARLQ